MAVAEWVIGGIALIGALLLVPLGLRLWRQVKAFGSLLGAASTTLGDAAAGVQPVQRPASPSGS